MENKRFNCEMIDCIRNSSHQFELFLSNREHWFDQLHQVLPQKLNGITLVGSGTSSTCAFTVKPFIEKVSQLNTTVVYPSEFIDQTSVYDPNRLYVFISQTGTSSFTNDALELALSKNLLCATMSESDITPLAKHDCAYIDMGCGYEEYPMRTTGYSTSVFTLMWLGIDMAWYYHLIDDGQVKHYHDDALLMINQYQTIIDQTLQWLTFNKRKMLQSQLLMFTGSGAYYGLALEAAMKVWETPQITSMGYELEESLHGPNFGYNSNHCVIALDDGGKDTLKSQALVRYMKEVKDNGFIIGPNPINEQDFKVETQCEVFKPLLYGAIIQTLAYKLAKDQGRDLMAKHDNSRMQSYFITHGK